MLPPPFHISYKDHITNEIVCSKIQAAIGPCEDLLTTVKKEVTMLRTCDQIKWPLQKVLQGTVPGERKRGRQKKRWENNIKEWTGLDFYISQRADEDRQRWQKIVADVSSGAFTTRTKVTGNRYIVTGYNGCIHPSRILCCSQLCKKGYR